MSIDELANDPVAMFIVIFVAVIVLVSLAAAVSLAWERWVRWWDARAAENAAAINHPDDCEICAPERAQLQQTRPAVDDAGRWVRS